MTSDWVQWRPSRDALVGAAVGVLLTVVVGSLWPDGGMSDPSATQDVPAVSVPPAPTAPALTPATTSSDAPSEDDSEEDGSEDAGSHPSEAPVLPDAAPAGTGPLPDTTRVTCPDATRTVESADELTSALAEAAPGDSIVLADGTYSGQFVTTSSGTEADPIFLCGSAGAVLDGGDVEGDYTFHLDGATHWRLVGFTVSGGQKGVMADGTVGSVIQGLTVSGTGDEAIHLRTHSTDNVVIDNTISDTGLRNEKYGEGVYIGSAVSNWCTYTSCEADRSDRNVVMGNTITGTTSEPIDIKEGTTGGVLVDNFFDGSDMTDADTWVNLKGNNYLVDGNQGMSATENGFETHDILPGWGDFNVFANNTGTVGGSGFGIASWPEGSNVVRCNNELDDAAQGLSNIPCS